MLTQLFPSDRVFTDFCDRDANWGPLLFLRPARERRLSLGRSAFGAALLGVPYGLAATILMTLLARMLAQPTPTVVHFPLLLTLSYWVAAQVTLVRAWNRRAQRLARWG